METINNVANAAAKAVWGEGEASKEPVSGVKGDVSKGEPYDAGNLGEYSKKRDEPAPTQWLTKHSVPDTPSQEKVELRLDNTGNKDGVNNTTDEPATASALPKADTRSPDEIPDSFDPDTIKGPGPKPIDVVAQQHGGDAGQAKKLVQESGNPGLSGESKLPEGDNKEGDEASKGTGEAYVKATGFSADGGDFDAKNPGAGKEADRKTPSDYIEARNEADFTSLA